MVCASSVFFVVSYYPTALKEISYLFNRPDPRRKVILNTSKVAVGPSTIIAADPSFSIVIPKINANSKVIPNVDPENAVEYQKALSQGVAHARGTVYPGQKGNSFYFAHSSDNFYNANRYNSVFYLMSKLQTGDLFYLVYKNQIYKYKVTLVKVVEASDVSYISPKSNDSVATLMTCWPAGTTLKRLIVSGNLLTN